MVHYRPSFLAFVCLTASVGCAHFDYAVPSAYSDVQLLPLESEQSSHARAVSKSEPYRIVGYSASKDQTLATIWVLDSPNASIQKGEPLETPSGHSSQALAINDRGDVAGFETTKDGNHRAVVWRAGERIVLHEQLEKLPKMSSHPVVWSKASSIDESGNAAGVLFTSEKKLFIFRFRGETPELYALGNASEETDVRMFNPANGQGVAVVTTAANSPRAVTFDVESSSSTEIPLLPIGNGEEFSFSRAFDQNQAGHVVGEVKQDNGVIRAFLSVKGRYFDLGVIRGAQDSSAHALNSKTKIVGKSSFSDGRQRAFIWAPGYKIRALSEFARGSELREFTHAFDINDRDVVVGDGTLMNRMIAFALVPGVSKQNQRISCLVKAPSEVMQFEEVSVSVVCTNVSSQSVDRFTVEAYLPEKSELVSVENRGGSLPPTSSAPNGRLKWSKEGLAASKTLEFKFTILPLASGNLTFRGVGIIPDVETSEFISVILTKVKKVQNTKLVKLLGTEKCSRQTVGSVLDFEVLPLGFEPTEVSLELAGDIIAKDSESPFAFSLENLPQGVHCASVIATSSTGERISSDSQCALVARDSGEPFSLRPVELSAGKAEMSHVIAVNNVGDAVGYVSGKGVKSRAALWFGDDDGVLSVSPTILPTEGFCGPSHSNHSAARDINSSGMIVGVCGPVWKQKSFLWNNGRFLAMRAGEQEVRVKGINEAGHVVGELGGNGAQSSAFTGYFDPAGTFMLRDLPGLGQESFASAHSINKFGTVVGMSHDLQNHAIIWKQGAPREVLDDGMVSRSTDVSDNQNPYVVGEFSRSGKKHAFLWTNDMGLVDIHDASLGHSSQARSVNKYGQIVGTYTAKGAKSRKRAFLKTCQQTFDLNTLIPQSSGWFLHEAVGINAKGQIVGNGTLKGVKKAFILSR